MRNVFFCLALGWAAAAAGAQTTFLVNVSDDVDDGTCDAIHCSFREAILAANAVAGTDTIAFNLPAGDTVIVPLTDLPAVTDPVTVDGETQPGADCVAWRPIVEIDGSSAGPVGLVLQVPATVRGLVLHGFPSSALGVFGGSSQIECNFIGTDVSGTIAVGNGAVGINVQGDGNVIGGTAPGAGNLISGNPSSGIRIEPGNGNRIEGNRIGTDLTGTVALANRHGITIQRNASDNLVGGTNAAARNLISGNQGLGVNFNIGASGNRVEGNYIGTDLSGSFGIPNIEGVLIQGGSNSTLIGGSAPGAGNLISGNGTGVRIRDPSSDNNRVEGNLIGTDASGNDPLGNGLGIFIQASSNVVGGLDPAGANLVAFNFLGVAVGTGAGNSLLGNAIHSNESLGIDLAPGGPTANDAGDTDAGANGLQNFPELTSATLDSGEVTVTATLDSTAVTDFRIEIFANTVCNGDTAGQSSDSEPFGEAELFLGALTVTTGATGNADIATNLALPFGAGLVITTTATNLANGETSEISACLAAEAEPIPTVGTLGLALLVILLLGAGLRLSPRLCGARK